jgi:zinc-binding alcohol dehydrogenase/oxidoreductase
LLIFITYFLKMKALTLSEPGIVAITEKEKPQPQKGEVLVRLQAAALNHRDQWIREGKYPGIKAGVTLGSDGAGVVEAAAADVEQAWLGKQVIINPNINWGSNPAVQSADYKILGMPLDGTFAEYICVKADRLAEKPDHLTIAQAAALPLGGLTAYRAVFTQGALQKGEKVLISGVGGGVAQFAFQFALAAGADVWVSSGSDEKISFAVEQGAMGGFNYKEEDWHKGAKKTSGGFNLIIDSAGGDQLNQLTDILLPAGRLVFYGATTGVPSRLNLHKLFWLQARLLGSTMGNDEEFQEMVKFIAKHRLEPIMEEPLPFKNIKKAFDTMKEGQQLGKLVVVME